MTGIAVDSDMTYENRQYARIRKVRPIALSLPHASRALARRTVSANVSRGGMLLVTRHDQFPPAGTAVDVFPFDIASPELPRDYCIPGRIVYTRFSPRAELRFAGVKFECEINEKDALRVGLDRGEESVADALKTLAVFDAHNETPVDAAETMAPALEETKTPRSVEAEIAVVRAELDRAVEAFLRATGEFMMTWGETTLRDAVVERHALARAKGPAGIGAMKREWRAQVGDVAALVDGQLGRDHLWPHRGPLDGMAALECNPYYDMDRDQPRPEVLDEIRKLLGFVGVLLVTHGFDDLAASSQWTPVAHETGELSFCGPIAISGPMRSALCDAARLFDQLVGLLHDGDHRRDDGSREAAARLWDRA